MENVFGECLDGKTILEVGTGRGGTTKDLISLLSKFKNCHLITTDIADDHFKELSKDFKNCKVDINFIKTDACCLEGIKDESIDYIICNYTLCAINSMPGCEVLALNKFKSVLKKDGLLYIQEEFPVNHIENQMQEIWSKKWKILKSCTSLLGGGTYNEIEPEVLKSILVILGFNNVKYKSEVYQIFGEDCLEFFKLRLNRFIRQFENRTYAKALKEMSTSIQKKATKAGGMEIPFYRITAQK